VGSVTALAGVRLQAVARGAHGGGSEATGFAPQTGLEESNAYTVLQLTSQVMGPVVAGGNRRLPCGR